jgi:hypothetical protein
MTPPVSPAMATHSLRPSRLPRNFAPPIRVSGSSKMMMICTAASWPVPSAVAQEKRHQRDRNGYQPGTPAHQVQDQFWREFKAPRL